MPIKFRCPKCSQAYTISSSKAGSKIRCQKCEAKIRIPEVGRASSAGKDSSEATGSPSVTTGEEEEKKKAAAAPAGAISPELQSAFDNLFDDDDEMFQDRGEPDGLEESGLIDDDEGESIAEDVSYEDDDEAAAGDEDAARIAMLEALDDEDDDAGPVFGEAPSKPAPVWGRPGDSAPPADDEDAVSFAEAPEAEPAASTVRTPRPVAPALPSELQADDGDDEEEGLFAGKDNEDEEMDLTPMVDVTFLLLIFFMITASFSIQKTLEVPPPDPEEKGQSASIVQPEELEETSIEVRIDARNMVTVEDEPVTNLDQLPAVMRGKRKPEILIVAHEQAMHEVVVKVVDAANEIGIQKIRMATTSGDD